MKCFLDLDGVLVNFVGGACKFHGKPNPYDRPESHGQWDCVELMGMRQYDFWHGLDYHFWKGLEWLPDGRRILDVVESVFGVENVCLLSSPCDTFGCADGKRAWVQDNIPRYSRKLILGSAKEFMAGPGKILIDDYPDNIIKFSQHGGETLLVPRPWNHLHKQNTLDEVDFRLSLLRPIIAIRKGQMVAA